MAPQLTGTKGPSLRWLQACTARATSSLPVPDSPCTSTGAMLRATLRMRRLTERMPSDSPTRRSSAAWQGAGAGAQNAIGTGVVGGMVTATILVLLFAPFFYVLVERFFGRRRRAVADSDQLTTGSEQ